MTAWLACRRTGVLAACVLAACVLAACTSPTHKPASPVVMASAGSAAPAASRAIPPVDGGAAPSASAAVRLPPPPDRAAWATVARPTEGSATQANPGGDAADPHAAALVRLLEEPLGTVRDKDDQVRLGIPDSRNWKRVRFRAIEHLTGFRYGSDLHAASIVLALSTREGRASDSRACIRMAETMARARIKPFAVELSSITETSVLWKGKPIIVHSVDGVFPWAFKRVAFSAAWAAYPAYDSACLIYAMGWQHKDSPELARMARDRWIRDEVERLETRTKEKPVRR